MSTTPASVRIDPFRDLDRLAEQLLGSGREPRTIPMDLYRTGDHYVLHLDLPGIDPGTVDLTVDGSVLTIRAERSPRTAEDLEWLVHERPSGSYQRQLKVGPGIDVEAVTATFEHGVLTVTLPVAERAKPRRIPVGARPTVVDGEIGPAGEAA